MIAAVRIYAPAICLFWAITAMPASAQMQDTGQPICDSNPTISADRKIQGCTPIIDSSVAASQRAIAFYVRSGAYSAKLDMKDAISDLDSAITLNPHFAEAFRARGIARINNRQNDLAIGDFTTAIRLMPASAAAYYGRGLAHLNKGELPAATKDFDAADHISPQGPNSWFLRGMMFKNEGFYDLAIAAFSRVIDVKAKEVYELALAYRGMSYVAKGDQVRAFADFNRCVREFPHFGEGYDQRGLILEKRGNIAGAMADFNQAVRYNPGMPNYLVNRGTLENKTGNQKAGAQDLARAKALQSLDEH